MADRLKGLQRLTGNAPSWAVSVAIHGLVLLVLGMVTWAVAVAPSPDHVLTLQTVPEAGADEAGVDNPAAGGAHSQDTRPVPARRPAEAVKPAPAPQAMALDASLAQIAPSPNASASAAGAADPMADLVASLSAASESMRTAAGGSGAGDLLAGTSAGFGNYIGQLRGTGLDIVLVLDATNSMAPYIEQARKRLHEILNVVTGLVPKARFGVVAYKDYGDEYGMDAVKVTPLTSDVASIRTAIDDISAGGGGDIPEPINEALKAATHPGMKWQRGRKNVIILVGDSPVHPSGRAAAFAEARQFAKELLGTVNVIDVGGAGEQGAPRKTIQADLRKIAQEGGGSAFLLQDADVFWRYLIVSVFGERFKNDVDVIIERFVAEKQE